MSNLKKAVLTTIADGAADELFTHELAKIAKNILDPNCAAIAIHTPRNDGPAPEKAKQ